MGSITRTIAVLEAQLAAADARCAEEQWQHVAAQLGTAAERACAAVFLAAARPHLVV